MKIKEKEKTVKLKDYPCGLFLYKGELCVKTEYGLDSYIISTGERFWGDARNLNDLANLKIKPCEIIKK